MCQHPIGEQLLYQLSFYGSLAHMMRLLADLPYSHQGQYLDSLNISMGSPIA
ncbi:MAG: hypothetical protein ACI8SJ_000604 [Shewanella sp.]|jgi:hypothetical protein